MLPCFFKPLVANMLLFLALVPQGVFAATEPPPVVMALSSAPKTLDSRLAVGGTSARLVRFLSLPLVRIGSDFSPQPAAATRFVQMDGRTIMFHLGDWSFVDGTPLKAEDVKAFYQSMMVPGTLSPFKGMFAPIKSIQTPDEKTVVFIFKKAIPPFVWRMFEHPLLKIDTGLDGAETALRPVGLGPYFVEEGSTVSHVQLALSPYWRGLKPASPRLAFKTVKDPLVRLLKVRRGEAHILQNDMPAVFFKYAQEKTGLKVLEAPSTNYTYLGFNFEDPDLKHLKVREALAYGINQNEIMRTLLFGFARPALSLLPQTHPFFWPVPQQEYDPQKAISLLEEAGYTPDANGIRLELRFSTTNSPSTLLFVQAIAAQLEKIGVKLHVNAAEWGSFFGNVLKGNFQLYLLTWVGTFDADIYHSLFHSSQQPPYGANRGRFSDPEMDKLLEAMMENISEEKRAEVVKAIQQRQQELLAYVPLWQRHNVALLHPSVEGFELKPDGSYDGLLQTKITE